MMRAKLAGARSGFTLLESIVSLVIFTVIGLALTLASRAGEKTERSVAGVASENRSVRSLSQSLTDELRSSCDTEITVTHQPDGNDTLRFFVPVVNGTTLGWGVYDRTLGTTDDTQNRAGWSLRYTVVTTVADGQTTRRLMRQILDAGQNVQKQKVVLDHLRSGGDTPPGFTVRKQGATWEITLSADSPFPHGRGIQEVFDVQARNQQ